MSVREKRTFPRCSTEREEPDEFGIDYPHDEPAVVLVVLRDPVYQLGVLIRSLCETCANKVIPELLAELQPGYTLEVQRLG